MAFSFLRRAIKRLIPRSVIRYRGPRSKRAVALTFDDGPHPEFTTQILGTLRERQASATFFVIGERAATHPEIVQQIRDQGCEIGNHSYTHPYFTTLSVSQIHHEIEQTDALIRSITGIEPSLFRTSYGSISM